MGKTLLVLIFLLFALPGKAQKEKDFFSEAISMHLDKYKKEAKKAFQNNDVKRADFLFDSLVEHCLKGSYLDNFKVKDLNKKDVFFHDFKKPVYLITYSSWIVISKGQFSAINKLAEKYKNEVQFVILFWDSYKNTKEVSSKYHKAIKLLYVDETKNRSPYVVRLMKHSLGFPTCFLLDDSKKIVNIKRSISLPYNMEFEKVFDQNYNSISEGISSLLLKNTSGYTQLESSVSVP